MTRHDAASPCHHRRLTRARRTRGMALLAAVMTRTYPIRAVTHLSSEALTSRSAGLPGDRFRHGDGFERHRQFVLWGSADSGGHRAHYCHLSERSHALSDALVRWQH
jgi:hypothetical protein